MHESDIGYLLNKTTQQMKSHLSKRLLDYDLTIAQWGVIRDIYMQEMFHVSEHQVIAASIAERLHMDRPTLSGIIERLRAKELVRTLPLPQDRRSQQVILTDKARKLYEIAEPLSRQTIDAALGGATGDQIEQLRATLRLMIGNLDKQS